MDHASDLHCTLNYSLVWFLSCVGPDVVLHGMFPSHHDVTVRTFQSRRFVQTVVFLQLHGTTKAFLAFFAMKPERRDFV